VKRALPLAKTAADYIALTRFPASPPGSERERLRTEFLRDSQNHWKSLNPCADDIAALGQ
jgi:hypothetical protein